MRITDRLSQPIAFAVPLLVFVSQSLLFSGSASTGGEPRESGSGIEGHECLDCQECHIAREPTDKNPELKPRTCPRHEAMLELEADLGPGVIILDEIENLYEPVHFDHLAHAEMVRFTGGCETCHHYTPPDSPHPQCMQCHPTVPVPGTALLPGLKRAYHRNCMDCHKEWDNETSCEVCHAKKDGAGTREATHSRYKRISLDELITFKTNFAEGDEVPFHHRNHSELYERDCIECHQEQSCKRCHIQEEEIHPMGKQEETDFHDTCFKCHENENCDFCHGRDPDDLFKHDSTGWPLKTYHSKLHCRECHGPSGAFQKLQPVCGNCHPQGWNPKKFDHTVTGVELEGMHRLLTCENCHRTGVDKGADCTRCH